MLKKEYLNLKNKIIKGQLDNGLKYIINRNKFHNTCSLVLFIRVGSKHENEKEYGLAHFLEHMLFKGTKKYETNLKFNIKVDELNGSINAGTAKNYTNYHIKLPSKNILEGLDILNQMVFYALVESNELNKEKHVVIEEINKSIDDSEDYLDDLVGEKIYKGNNLGHLIVGKKKNILGYKRQDLINFIKKYYVISNCCLSLAGDIPKGIVQDIKRIFNHKSKKNVRHEIIPYIYRSIKPVFVFKEREQQQIFINLTFPIFNIYDKRKYGLDIIVDILYGNLTSRLWLALREYNPLVYGIRVFYELYEEAGQFSIALSLDKKNLSKAFELLYKELERLKNEIIKDKEYKNVINNLIHLFESEEEDNMGIAEYYGERYLLDEDLDTYSDVIKKYKEYSPQKIKELVNLIFDFKRVVVGQVGNVHLKDFKKIYNDKFMIN